MANEEQLRRLTSGDVATWNAWREANPEERVDLSGSCLNDTNLSGVDLVCATLHRTDLTNSTLNGARLTKADLRGADLSEAHLSGAELYDADLSGALLASADLAGASLSEADLRGAKLTAAKLTDTDLYGADLTGADMKFADLTNANVGAVRYRRQEMYGRYRGIRVDGCHGDALFKRDAQDQDYIDTLGKNWATTAWRRFLLRCWGWIDYGRSLTRVALFGVAIILAFGLAYHLYPGLVDRRSHQWTPYSPWYYSVVTFATLGFGDISASGVAGEVAVTVEVLLGYLTLGLLISVLGNKVARRS